MSCLSGGWYTNNSYTSEFKKVVKMLMLSNDVVVTVLCILINGSRVAASWYWPTKTSSRVAVETYIYIHRQPWVAILLLDYLIFIHILIYFGQPQNTTINGVLIYV